MDGGRTYQFGDVLVDVANFRVTKGGKRVRLEPKALEMLIFLIENRNRLVEKRQLLDEIWSDAVVTENAMTKVIAKLRKTLGDGLGGARYIETVPTRGYRFIAEVVAQDDEQRREPVRSVAVMPFVNVAADPDAEYLSEGIAESIITDLSRLPALRVLSRGATFRYKGRDVLPQELGRELNVQAVVTGRILQLGGRLIVRTELVDAASGVHLWGQQYDHAPADILQVQESISREISKNLRLQVSGEQVQSLLKRNTGNPAAYQLYLRGVFCSNRWTEEGWWKSVEYFNSAIALDPEYALAYAGLTQTYVHLGLFGAMPPREAYERAAAAAAKAIQIDDGLAAAYASLGFIKMIAEWDWEGARLAFARALGIDPNHAKAHHLYGYHLIHMGRYEEAIAEMRQAESLEPLTMAFVASVGDACYYARAYDRAIEQLRAALDIDPHYSEARVFLGRSYEQKRMYDEALEEFRTAVELTGGDPETVASLARAHALAGHADDARTLYDQLKHAARTRYIDPSFFAIIHLGLGELDEAFVCLERAYEDHSAWMVHLSAEPIFDGIRSDPRFADLIHRVGLPTTGLAAGR